MARGGISGERGQGGGGGGGSGGGTRTKNFKKTVVDREPNSDGGGYLHSTSRPKFQESLKNHENKYYDGKRINGWYYKLDQRIPVKKAQVFNEKLKINFYVCFHFLQRIQEYRNSLGAYAEKMITITSWVSASNYKKTFFLMIIRDISDVI